MSAQDEFDEAVVDYSKAEKKGDEFIKALCKAMLQTIKVQDECECDPNQPVHPIKFAKTKAQIGEAIGAATGAMEAFAKAHATGEKTSDECGGISTQGGGGGKAARIWRDFYLADAYQVASEKHYLA